jgi:hypothetical protein
LILEPRFNEPALHIVAAAVAAVVDPNLRVELITIEEYPNSGNTYSTA